MILAAKSFVIELFVYREPQNAWLGVKYNKLKCDLATRYDRYSLTLTIVSKESSSRINVVYSD